MVQILIDMERMLEELLGAKQDSVFMLEKKITVEVKNEKESLYLWIRDMRGKYSYAWLFDILEVEEGYLFRSTKEGIVECNSLQEVFDIVKKREY